jgi:hypothetical protein
MMKVDVVKSKGGYLPTPSIFLNKDPEKTVEVAKTEEIKMNEEIFNA